MVDNSGVTLLIAIYQQSSGVTEPDMNIVIDFACEEYLTIPKFCLPLQA